MIEILRAGPLATIQDLGRPGLAYLGVTRSGAADPDALRVANRLVGNAEAAACIEITFGGFAARFDNTAVVAFAGAPCPVRSSATEAAMYAPIDVAAGDELSLGPPARGVRTYLAVRGGIDVAPVLGSRSTDILAGLGPDPVRPGMRLPVGTATVAAPSVDVAPVPPLQDEIALRVVPGPRDDWFAPAALTVLTSHAYEVTTRSNRVGIRLSGPALERSGAGELPPEGMVYGALQVPPNGQPVLFLADHPVTGGYPVIAVVWEQDMSRAAQARPGQRLLFHTAVPR